MIATRAKVLFWCALIVVSTGCTTPDSLMKLTLQKGSGDEREAAEKLGTVVENSSMDDGLRCWALRALSYMEQVPPPVFGAVARVVRDTSEAPCVRSWGAFTLGQWGKKEGLGPLVDAMSSSVDARTGYHVLEALSRMLPMLLEDTGINERMIEAMTIFAARQSQDLPTVYALLREYAVGLVALTITAERIIKKGPIAGSMQRSEEVYTAVFRMLSNIEVAKGRFLAAYADNAKALSVAFELAYSAVDKRYRPTWLLLAWYGGVLGDNRELAELCEDRLALWLKSADPSLRILTLWSLTRMELYSSKARAALVATVIRSEEDEEVLKLLGMLAVQDGVPDQVQRLLEVKTR
jgi:hypothetical protein